jgi:hypothetical protein
MPDERIYRASVAARPIYKHSAFLCPNVISEHGPAARPYLRNGGRTRHRLWGGPSSAGRPTRFVTTDYRSRTRTRLATVRSRRAPASIDRRRRAIACGLPPPSRFRRTLSCSLPTATTDFLASDTLNMRGHAVPAQSRALHRTLRPMRGGTIVRRSPPVPRGTDGRAQHHRQPSRASVRRGATRVGLCGSVGTCRVLSGAKTQMIGAQ